MCNINAVFRPENKLNISVVSFLQSVTSNSYAHNYHADGIYTSSDNKVRKSTEKLNLFKYQEQIDKSNIIITHQRLSSSGFSSEYHHPFENKEFILVHNGVINQFKKDTGSDTYGFFLDFIKEFENLKYLHYSRDEIIIKSLKNLFKEDAGWYSILIHDKKTKLSYYFKNTSPSINFYKIDNILYISTIDDNKKFISLLDTNPEEKLKVYDIKDNCIYRIKEIENKISVVNVGELCNKKIAPVIYEKKYKNYWERD